MQLPGATALGMLNGAGCPLRRENSARDEKGPGKSLPVTLFLGGDVMTGRGIDQVLPRPSEPRLYESYMKSSLGYVELAERVNGTIPKPADFSYVWGDALKEWQRVAPDAKIVNLETTITTSEDWVAKGINYRMHPGNISCIKTAGIDCCTLANNHALDWGHAGLAETLDTLKNANVKTAGAGRNLTEAEAPATVEIAGKSRVIVFAFGSMTSGIPRYWVAGEGKPGVNLLRDFSDDAVGRIAAAVGNVKRPGDIVVASIHWGGGNWGYQIPREQKVFAHKLVDQAAVDVIHGHSSHHPRGIEVS